MDTIASIITAPASGAVGIIRISGNAAFEIADRIFTGRCGPLSRQKGYTVHHGFIHDEGRRVDECLATVFTAPHSYTGENILEFSCHGGLNLLKSILSLVCSAGACQAKPGEFTKRAFLNGKMDLSQAEAVADIIAAKGLLEAQNAAQHLQGLLGKKISVLIDSLVAINAGLLAYVDFPDEDITEPELDKICKEISRIENECRQLAATYERGRILKEGVPCVLLGKPNTGKSSLMNILAGTERSIVTDEEGTTRDIIEETIVLSDIKLRIMDTAGLRKTLSKAESIGVEKAKEAAGDAELLLCMFDGSRLPDDNDKRLADLAKGKKAIGILNKTDLPNKFPKTFLSEHFRYTAEISALTGHGIHSFTDTVRNAILTDTSPLEGEIMLTSLRQKEALEQASKALARAVQSAAGGLFLDALSYDILEAIAALGLMTGQSVNEETINHIFSRFCVGK